jgi:hypothetical protein
MLHVWHGVTLQSQPSKKHSSMFKALLQILSPLSVRTKFSKFPPYTVSKVSRRFLLSILESPRIEIFQKMWIPRVAGTFTQALGRCRKFSFLFESRFYSPFFKNYNSYKKSHDLETDHVPNFVIGQPSIKETYHGFWLGL